MKKIFTFLFALALTVCLKLQTAYASLSPIQSVTVTATAGTVGPTYYTTLKAAFDKINDGTHKGAITIKIAQNTTETASAVLYKTGYNSASNYASVNIYPTATCTVSGTLAAPLVELNGATNVTINGSLNQGNASAALSFNNKSTSNTAGTSTIRFINSAENDTVKYCTIRSGSTDASGGDVFFSTATSGMGNSNNAITNCNITNSAGNIPINAIYSAGSASYLNSNNTISNNNFYDLYYGIYIYSNSTAWNITNNSFYETLAAQTQSSQKIIQIGTGDNYNVTDNYIGGTLALCKGNNYTRTIANDDFFYGIYLTVGTTNASNILRNTIKKYNATMSVTDGTYHGFYGIYAASGNLNINNNTIDSIYSQGSNSPYIYGIYTSASSSANINNNTISDLNSNTSGGEVCGLNYNNNKSGVNSVSNNFIYNLFGVDGNSIFGLIFSAGTATFSNNIISLGNSAANTYYGINLSSSSAADNVNLYFNTVYIAGNPTSGTSNSYALYSFSNTGTQNLRNNIFTNARSNNGSTGMHYAAYFNYSTNANLTLDYNDYYATGGGGVLGYFNSTDVYSLPLITSMDANSKNVDPVFASAGGTSAANYLPSSKSLIAAKATGITTDYSGTTRSVAYPAMGALEYNVTPPITVSATGGTTSGNYFTLKAAFDKINDGTHQGVINILVNKSTTETSSAKLYQSGYNSTSSYTSVNIYPTASGDSIYGNFNSPLIDLNGATNVTIDGRVNESGSTISLIISNANTANNNATSTIRLINGASFDTIKYCRLQGSSQDGTSGIVNFSTSTSGNNNNALDHNDVTNAGGNRPYNGIFSNGSNGFPNSFNTVSNNNIFNLFNPDWTHTYAINLSENNDGNNAYNSDWTITGNSFYQTSEYVSNTDRNINIIYVYSTTGNNFNISSNYIGGSAPHCGGTPWTKTQGNNSFSVIVLNAGSVTASNIQGNIIKNFNLTNTGYYYWGGISTGSGNVNIGTITGNIIGDSTGTGSIVFTGGGSDASGFTGIRASTYNTVNIQNNIIGSITLDKDDHQYANDFTGIYMQSNSGTVTNNTIGSNTTANSIQTLSDATETYDVLGQYAIGILSEGNSVTISNNNIANMTNGTTNTNASTNGWIYGMAIYRSDNNITGNNIHDLTISNGNTNAGPTPAGDWRFSSLSAAGIAVSNPNSSIQTISNNNIYNISNTYSHFQGHIAGIYFYAGQAISSVNGNFIHGLSVSPSSDSGNVYGIKIAGGVTTYSNNIITIGGNTPANYYGIYDYGTWSEPYRSNLYFNTIYLYGSLASGNNSSYALYSSTNFIARDYRNNIFYNARTNNGGTGTHYAAFFNYSNNYNLNLGYNDYYATGIGGILGNYNSANVDTLPLIETMDVNSRKLNPVFASAGGTMAANYLPSEIKLGGIIGTGITTDYAGNTRSVTVPAMGAWDYTVCLPTTGDTTATACNSFKWYDSTYTSSSTPTHTLTNVLGCDSIVTLHLTINNSTTGDTTAIACNSFEWYGTNYTSSATPTHQFTNVAGCDSIVTLHLTINNSTTGDTTATACNSFNWYGANYTSSTSAPTHQFVNAAGCDSIVTLHLTINNSTTGDTTATACNSFNWYGTNYTSSTSTPTHQFINAVGCDSIVTLHLTINNSTTGDTTATACNSFNWYGANYTSSTSTPTHQFINAAGCDSIVTLHLTINYSNTGDTTATACNSFNWYGVNYTSSTSTPTHQFVNAAGCDSIVTLHLTINYSNTGDTTATACNSFNWYGVNYTSSTSTPTHQFVNATGCDSIVTLHLTINNSTTGDTTATACDNFKWYGTNYTSSTSTPTHQFINAVGCDSTVTLHLIIKSSTTGDTTVTACDNFEWYGTNYTISGTPTHVFKNAVGCDSTVTLNLTITVCDGIIENNNNLQAVISPNPAKQNVNVSFNVAFRINCIYIMNTLGQTVYAKQINAVSKSEQIDISELQQGVYFIMVNTESGNIIKKIIKEN